MSASTLAWTVLVLAAPLRVHAQAEPKPQKGSATSGSPRYFTAAFRLDQFWDSNPSFLLPSEPGDRLHSLSASFSATRAGRRGQLSATLDGGGTVYGRRSSLNSAHLAGGLSGTRRLSSRATLTAREGLAFTRTSQAAPLTDAGLALPESRARIIGGGAGLSYQASPFTSLGLSVGHDAASFSSAGLVSGSTYFVGASAQRTLGSRDFVSASYGGVASHTLNATAFHHTFAAGWNRILGRRWSANASFGGGRFGGPAGGSWTHTAAASLNGKFRRDSVYASYARSIGQAFGLGRDRVADAFSAGYNRTMGRRLYLSGSASWVFSSDPADPRFDYRGESYHADAHYQWSPRLGLSGGYSRRRSAASAPAPTISGGVWRLSLAYQWANRGAGRAQVP